MHAPSSTSTSRSCFGARSRAPSSDIRETLAQAAGFTPARSAAADLSAGSGRLALDTLSVVDEEVIPVLYVEDAARAVAWYERLGFRKEWEHQFEPGFPLFVCVARGRVRLYLSEHKGDARPNTLIHLNLKDIDAVSAEFGIPVDEEGLAGRECDLEDLDGNRLRVATPRS